MPIGKSGKYFMNPNEMRRHGDEPGESSLKGNDKGSEPKDKDKDGDNDHSGGDGAHHHEIIKHDDGMIRSVHTHPDGQKDEPMEHGSYDEAKADMDAKMGEGGDEMDPDAGAGDDGMTDVGGGEDMAGMYGRCAE